jgi:superfamily II DNA or RNA helicase
MFKEILSNLSEDELYSFLDRSAIDFVTKLNSESDWLDKARLASLIANTLQAEFIFNVKLRYRMIDSFTPEVLVQLFPEFDLSQNEVSAEHYDAVQSWASNNLKEFSERLGLLDTYQNSLNNDKPFQSLLRVEPSYALYPYQQQLTRDVLSSYEEGNDRVLVHLPTGAGKTRTAMNIASEHLRQSSTNVVIWFADREELCQQAFDEFKDAWGALGNQATSLYAFYSESDESLGGIDSGFVVAGLHKFLKLRKSNSNKLNLLYQQLRKSVTLVIFDEAHKSVAPQFKQVVEDFVEGDDFNGRLLGLTATPGRSYSKEGLSEEDQLLANFYNNNKISMTVPGYVSPIDYLVENLYLAKANFKSLNYDHSGISAFELSNASDKETMKALARNVDRNQRIIETVLEECKEGSQIIIFACTVEHSFNLSMAIASLGIRAASIDSKNDTTESRRAKIDLYKNKKIQVLVNYNVLTAGFDAPATNVAIIAKPMNSLVQYLQMAGRAMRGAKSGGNIECRVYTVMDDIPEFQSVNIAFEYWNDMWQEQ